MVNKNFKITKKSVEIKIVQIGLFVFERFVLENVSMK